MSKSYTGVSWNSATSQYESTVTSKGKKYRCGFFFTEKEAVIARDKAIIKHGLKVKLQVLKPVVQPKS